MKPFHQGAQGPHKNGIFQELDQQGSMEGAFVQR